MSYQENSSYNIKKNSPPHKYQHVHSQQTPVHKFKDSLYQQSEEILPTEKTLSPSELEETLIFFRFGP